MSWEFSAEGSFVVTMFTIPSSIANKVVGNTSSVQAHKISGAAQVCRFHWLLSGTKIGFILSSSAMIDTVTDLIFHDAISSWASELVISAFRFFLSRYRQRFAVFAFIFAIRTVPFAVAELSKWNTSRVRALELSSILASGRRNCRWLSWTEMSLIFTLFTVPQSITDVFVLNTFGIRASELMWSAVRFRLCRCRRFAKLSFIFSLLAVPSSITNHQMVDTDSIIAHEFVYSTLRSWNRFRLGRAEVSFIFTFWAVSFSVAYKLHCYALFVRAGKFISSTFWGWLIG